MDASKAPDARLTELLKAHFHAVWRAVRRLGVMEDVADDAAQEVFIVAARKLDSIEPGSELRFLYGIALRIAANARRARLNRREVGAEEALIAASHALHGEALLERKRLRELLDVVLDELPDDLRTAFVLFELEGFSMREISAILEVPAGTVASRLRRGREAFQAAAERVRARVGDVPVGDEP
ncbi:MAG TPA: sigma-70 family RNA polymerase sigma factor [Polyangiaceae bacterium]